MAGASKHPRFRPARLVLLVLLGPVSGAGIGAGPAHAEEPVGPTGDRPAEDRPAVEDYEEARRAYERGDYHRALEDLRRAVRKDEQPVYVYNIGRTLEAMGRYAEAYQEFLRARALPGAAEDLRELARAGVERLASLHDRATVRLQGILDGELVQIDDQVVVDTAKDQVLAPGRHQLCVTSADGARTSCWARTLPPGVRTSWPPAAPAATRGELALPDDGVEALSLDGAALVADAAKLRTVEVDVGRHEVVLLGPGGARARREVDVLSGRRVVLAAPAAAEPGVASTAPHLPPPSPWPWAAAGSGTAAILAGAALFVVAASERDVETFRVEGVDVPVTKELSQREHADDWRTARNLDTAGGILTGIGVAALATAVVVWLTAPDGP